MQPLEAVGSFLHRHAFVRNKNIKIQEEQICTRKK